MSSTKMSVEEDLDSLEKNDIGNLFLKEFDSIIGLEILVDNFVS